MSQTFPKLRVDTLVEANGLKLRGAHAAPTSSGIKNSVDASAPTAYKGQATIRHNSFFDIAVDGEECLLRPGLNDIQDASMTPVNPGLASFEGQPASQAPMGSSSGLNNLQTQALWNLEPMRETAAENTGVMNMADRMSQSAFMPPIPTRSGINTFDPLVTTTWPYNGPISMQTPVSSRPDGTRQTVKPEEWTVLGTNSGKSSQQHTMRDESDVMEPIQPDTCLGTLPEGVPDETNSSLAGATIRDGGNQTMSNACLTSSEPTPRQRDNRIVNPGDPDDWITKAHKERNDKSGNSSSRCSLAQPRPTQEHRVRNRKAATKCRAKAKAARTELETTEKEMEWQHQELSAQASSLQDEVLLLKNELLMHGNCDCEAIQRYLTNAANSIGSGMGQR